MESFAVDNADMASNLPNIAHGVVPATQKARRLDRQRSIPLAAFEGIERKSFRVKPDDAELQ